jgi:putative FmdB family regulatory protein
MPLYVFECRACGQRFEELVFGSEAVRCTGCHSLEIERALPRVAVHAGGGAERAPSEAPAFGPGACGSCGDPRGPGACRLE